MQFVSFYYSWTKAVELYIEVCMYLCTHLIYESLFQMKVVDKSYIHILCPVYFHGLYCWRDNFKKWRESNNCHVLHIFPN